MLHSTEVEVLVEGELSLIKLKKAHLYLITKESIKNKYNIFDKRPISKSKVDRVFLSQTLSKNKFGQNFFG